MNTTVVLSVLCAVLAVCVIVLSCVFAKRKKRIRTLTKSIDQYLETGAVTDFSTRDDLLAQLQNAVFDLESRQVIADISHDLKTPLTVIQGYSKALNEGRVPEEKKEKYLETIYDKSVLSANLIDSLFDCVKMEHPDYKINPVTVDLSEQIKEILAEKYNEIEENGFDIDVDIPERRIEFAVDKKLFERLFENLLDNSLQYNPAGTTIFIKLREEKDSLVLTVADNGTGIPQELRENIFKPFVTSNNARSSGKGTGLGLAITKRIVELHGGSISLKDCGENSKYKTEFEIRFPRVMQ